MTYDSTQDTMTHIAAVRNLLYAVTDELSNRALRHDASKLADPEKQAFDLYTPRLRELTYGSAEYQACLDAMRPAIEHHYAHNSHHPEHYPNGIRDMDLFDIVEMFCDWQAAAQRHADGNVLASLETNRVRFGLSDQLYQILKNTAVVYEGMDDGKQKR
jgi:hypothetical protein